MFSANLRIDSKIEVGIPTTYKFLFQNWNKIKMFFIFHIIHTEWSKNISKGNNIILGECKLQNPLLILGDKKVERRCREERYWNKQIKGQRGKWAWKLLNRVSQTVPIYIDLHLENTVAIHKSKIAIWKPWVIKVITPKLK